MRKIILHLGSHKTGSTSVQVSLERSRATLELSGVFLPSKIPTYLKENTEEFATALKLRSDGNFADIAYYLKNNDPSNSKKNASKLISTEFSIQDTTTLIISSEDYATLTAEEVKSFRTFFHGDEIEFHLIYFLRHQTHSIVGVYQTSLQHYPDRIENFDSFVSAIKETFKYDEIIKRWDSSFNFATINLLDYSDAIAGNPIDSVQEFGKILNQILKTQINLEGVEAFNQGLGAATMRWLDQLHPHLKMHSRESLITLLTSLDPKSEKQLQFLTLKEFNSICEEFSATNKNILNSYKLRLHKPDIENQNFLLDNRPNLGDLIDQLMVSKGDEIKNFMKNPLLTVIENENPYFNPYIGLDTETITESVEISLNSSQVIAKQFVPKFPDAAERTRDLSDEESDIATHLQQLDRIRQERTTAQQVLHLGCKWGYMTRLLFSLGDSVEVHCSDLDSKRVSSIKHNTNFARAFYLNSECELPFKDEFADMVVADHSFVSYVSAKNFKIYLSEISRILTFGGHFFFNSISMSKKDNDTIDTRSDSDIYIEQVDGKIFFNVKYLKLELPSELKILSHDTNGLFDFYVLQKLRK